jgi:hypothetical protein
VPEFRLKPLTGRRCQVCRACTRARFRRWYADRCEREERLGVKRKAPYDPAKHRAQLERAQARRERRAGAEAGVEAHRKDLTRSRSRRLGKLGLLHQSDQCLDCGRPTEVLHHEDYEDVTHVVSLCRRCHMRRHWAVWRRTGGGPVRHPWEYDDA